MVIFHSYVSLPEGSSPDISKESNRLRHPVGALGWFHTDLANTDARGGAYQPDQTTLGGDATRPATGRVFAMFKNIHRSHWNMKEWTMHFSEFGEWIRTGFTYHMCIYHNIYIAPIIPMFYVYFHGILHICSTHIIPFSCANPWQELHNSFAEDLRWSQLPWFPGAWQCDAKDYDDALRSQCSALNKSYALRFQERVGWGMAGMVLVGWSNTFW